MLGLNEAAVLVRRTGFQAGKPVYAAEGALFRCRAETVRESNADARGRAGAMKVTLYVRGVSAAPGDRVEFADGSTALITRVESARGPGGEHHAVWTAEGDGTHG